MADLRNRGAVTDIEGTLARLRGITSARVALDENGEIAEIHVLANDTRHPKQIGRDIESALFSEHGIRIDHRKISIAQTRGELESPSIETRLKFLGIDYSLDRATARARVSIGRSDETYIGVASAAVSGDLNQENLVARATLEAVQEFIRATSLNGEIAMELLQLTRSEQDDKSYFVATIRVRGERGNLDLIGSALVRDDPWRAAASATLDALNRRLSTLCS